jgi:hypothetical protein
MQNSPMPPRSIAPTCGPKIVDLENGGFCITLIVSLLSRIAGKLTNLINTLLTLTIRQLPFPRPSHGRPTERPDCHTRLERIRRRAHARQLPHAVRPLPAGAITAAAVMAMLVNGSLTARSCLLFC